MKYNTAKKGALSGMLALALITTAMPAPRAQAATMPELQAQIQSLLAQIQSLRSIVNGVAPAPACLQFTSDLTIGRSGADVTRLQQFLIQNGNSIPAGATGYFGEQTRQALMNYQRTNGISPAVGYFGPVTRVRVNAACTISSNNGNQNPGGSTNNGGNESPGSSIPSLSGEAELNNFTFLAGDDVTLEEGDKNRVIGEIEFTVEDGDANLQRVDIVFTPDSANNEKDPWDTFSEISIWDGNDRIARIDTSKKSAWRDENRSTGAWTLRFSGLNYFLEEDSDQKITVQASIASSVRGISDGEEWTLRVPNNGIRALDANRVLVETGDASETVELSLEEAGTADELIIRTSDDDPDATTIVLDRTNRSGFTPVFAFDIDTDDSVNDVEIRRLPVEFTVSASTMNTFVRDVRIVIDGKTYTRKAIVDGTTGTVTFEFRSNELVIDSGDRVTAVVEVDFKPLTQQFEGTTIEGRVAASAIIAEGADDLSGSQLSGVVTGELHSLKTSGAVVAVKSTTADVTTTQGSLNDYATYKIEVDVTATNQDVYLPANSNAVVFQLRDASGNVINTSSSAVVSSNAREQGGFFYIPEGQTKTITLDVTFQPQTALTAARLRLISLEYASTATTPNQSWSATPINQFETNIVTIVD